MNKSKTILTVITIVLLVVVFFLAYLLFYKYVLKIEFENNIMPFANKNAETVFKIDKIVLFSNCDAKRKTASSSNFTIENLYQYTDIAIFINSSSGTEEKNLKNTFKKVTLNNFNFTNSPSDGEPKLYFKGINQFSKSDLPNEEYLINDSFDFEITSENEADLNKPILYNNLANPITLSYVNNNIKSDFTITDTSSPITYDGSLLKKCNIPLSSINCKLSFDIYITNNLDEEFKSTVYVDIPLENENNSIYDGSITLKQNTNILFYRYK